MNTWKHLAVAACAALLLLAIPAAGVAQADFGIKELSVTARNVDGTVDTQAGSHPFEWELGFEMNQDSEEFPEGRLRDLIIDLPAGMAGNPLALPRCTMADFEGGTAHCPGNTQVGIARIASEPGVEFTESIFNLVPPQGVAARLGLTILNFNGFIDAGLRTSSDYGITASDITVPTNVLIRGITARIWGVPMEKSHDAERSCGGGAPPCSSDAFPAPFLSLPTSCTGPLKTTLSVDSVEEPGVFLHEDAFSVNESGEPVGLENCGALPFEPTITSQPETTSSDSPTGLHFHLRIPQNEDPKGLAAAHLKDTVLTLPQGLVVNPSAATGRTACSSAQVDLHGPGPANCPPASKIGTVQIQAPALDHPVNGAIYLAKQGDNPFNSLLALYIAVDDPQSGVVVKLAGKVEPDPVTGQLKTVFQENPQLPFEDLDVQLTGGPRAPLTTPSVCPAGPTFTAEALLTPWSAPEGKDALLTDSFAIGSAPAGGPCPATEAQMPSAPGFEAGTANPLAGSYSPFVLKLSRENGSRRFTALNVSLPPGLTGKLAGTATCSDAQLAIAESRSREGEGALEQASPSCPPDSQLGTVTVGAGSGSPVYVTGRAYLAGPYKGAPVSMAIVTPAVAGPFDLGVVVVRSPLYINEETAQISVRSDPIPQILHGIPLDVRSIAVHVDRNEVTLNPTSCDPLAIGAEALSPFGIAALSDHFQVGGCKALPYQPKLQVALKGPTHRNAHPKLIATLTAKPGEANTRFAQVKLPRAAFLDQAHIGTVCTRVQFAAGGGNGERCPAASVYGRAEAKTPLLGYPLKGTVFLRSSNHTLPDLVVAFKGPDYQPIHFALDGKTDSVKGALRNTFEAAPDVPVSKFRLEMFGGKKGLIVLSDGFCAHPRLLVRMRAQDNAVHNTRPKVKAACGGAKHSNGSPRRRAH